MSTKSIANTLSAVGRLSYYAGRTSTLKVIDPGNPRNSSMFLKVMGGSPKYRGPGGESVGSQMPQNLPPLSDENKLLIKNWICGGAQ